jgi:hypothetical protein
VRALNGWRRITKMCRVFAVVFCQMGLFSARERLGELFSAWKRKAGCQHALTASARSLIMPFVVTSATGARLAAAGGAAAERDSS